MVRVNVKFRVRVRVEDVTVIKGAGDPRSIFTFLLFVILIEGNVNYQELYNTK